MIRADLWEPFKKALVDRKFVIHHCSLCGYPCGWLLYMGEFCYDHGCDCVTYGPRIRESSNEEFMFYLDEQNGHVESIENFIKEGKNE